MKRILLTCGLMFGFASASVQAVEEGTDSLVADTLATARHKRPFFRRVEKAISGFVREFSNIDTAYIEPQHYIYTVMLENTNTYEVYTLNNVKGQKISFAPDLSWRFGPYVGWSWMFLGYTLDLKHLNASSSHSSKKEFNISLYSSMIGIDFFWRETGNDYHIQHMSLGDDGDQDVLHGVKFDGLKASIRGLNLYYIFNHRKFSYPAAYSQSTMQRRSAGSWMVGLGYTRHELEVDWGKLTTLTDTYLNHDATQSDKAKIDSSLMFSKVKYSDYSATIGYGYNWVFARNILFNASLSMGLAYNQSSSNNDENDKSQTRNFQFRNFNLDGVGRFGIVYNNMRWYVGASAVIHTYNYKKDNFSTNNSFGSANIYVGYNFGAKKQYRKKNKANKQETTP